MALEQTKINEILDYARKAGLTNAAKFFNVSRGSIYNWEKKQEHERSESINQIKLTSKSESRLILARFKFSNKYNYCYVYCIKDSLYGLEFYATCENNNYKTPIIFLKNIISTYNKIFKFNFFNVRIKNLYGTKNFAKFKDIVPDCEIRINSTAEKVKFKAVDKPKLKSCNNIDDLLIKLLHQQLIYNYTVNKEKAKETIDILPTNLDKVDLKEFSSERNKYLKRVLKYFFKEIELLLHSGDYITTNIRLKLLEVLVNNHKDQDFRLTFYQSKERYFALTGKKNEALKYFSELNINKYNSNIKFFVNLNICLLHFYYGHNSKFNYYLKKLKKLNSKNIQADFKAKFEMLLINQQKISFNEIEILFKKLKEQFASKISKEVLFELCFEYSNICNGYGQLKKAHRILDIVGSDPLLKKHRYMYCQYYLHRAKCYKASKEIPRSFDFYCLVIDIAEKYNFKYIFYSAKLNQAYYYLWQGELEKCFTILDNCRQYAKISSNFHFERLVNQMFLMYYYTVKNYSKAGKYAILIYEYSKETKKIHLIADALNNCCYVFSENYNKRKFLHYITKYEEINKIIKSHSREIRINLYKGIFYENSGKNKDAIKFFKKGFVLAKKENQFIASLSRRLGYVHYKNADYDSALAYTEISITSTKMILESTISELYLLKAKIFHKQKELNKAVENLNKAKEMAIKYNNDNLKECLELEEKIIKEKEGKS